MFRRHPRSSTKQERLSPQRKRMFLLFLNEGLSQLEACRRLGITTNNVLHERDMDANFDKRCVDAWSSILFEAENSVIELVRGGYWPAVKYVLEVKTRTLKDENKRWTSDSDFYKNNFGEAKSSLREMVSVMQGNMGHYTPEKILELERSCSGQYSEALENNRKLFNYVPSINLIDVDRNKINISKPVEGE